MALNILALALPLMTMQIYDRVLSNRSVDTLTMLSVGVMVAACAEFVLRVCRSMVVGLNGASFEHEAATKSLQHLLEAEPRASSRSTSATLAQDIGAAARLKDYFGGQMMVTLLVDAPFMLIFLCLAAYLARWLAIVQCLVLIVFSAICWRQGRKLRKLIDARELQDNTRYSFIMNSLQVIHTIKALCLESITARKFEEVQRDSAQLNYAGSLSYSSAQIMTVTVVCTGAPLAVWGYITSGTLIACVLLSGQMMQTLQRGLALWMRMQDIGLAKERLKWLLSLPSRNYLPLEEIRPSRGEVRIEEVQFQYGETAVIDSAQLTIAPGDTVALSGAPGSGKTTLLELMAGIYVPDRGRIMLSDMDVSRLPMEERVHYIAYLPMRGMILRGSIMDNLTGFDPRHRAQARTVADKLGIEEAVSLLPSGYDTPLEGLSTDVIPPGLKQRISMARALLFKPRLILFDNADHGMDKDSYSCIFDLLARLKGKATMVLVSEDKNIMSLADRVIELRRGHLVPVMESSPIIADRKRIKGLSV
jgi:ATP-binding cassette subfamily C protein LapB